MLDINTERYSQNQNIFENWIESSLSYPHPLSPIVRKLRMSLAMSLEF